MNMVSLMISGGPLMLVGACSAAEAKTRTHAIQRHDRRPDVSNRAARHKTEDEDQIELENEMLSTSRQHGDHRVHLKLRRRRRMAFIRKCLMEAPRSHLRGQPRM